MCFSLSPALSKGAWRGVLTHVLVSCSLERNSGLKLTMPTAVGSLIWTPGSLNTGISPLLRLPVLEVKFLCSLPLLVLSVELPPVALAESGSLALRACCLRCHAACVSMALCSCTSSVEGLDMLQLRLMSKSVEGLVMLRLRLRLMSKGSAEAEFTTSLHSKEEDSAWLQA